MENEYKVIFIFKYVAEHSAFILDEAVITYNEILISGENKGKYFNDLYEVLDEKNKIYTVDPKAIERGFVITYHFDAEDIQEAFKNIFNDTISLFSILFKIGSYDIVDNDLILKINNVTLSKQEYNTLKQIYKAKVLNMLSQIINKQIDKEFVELTKTDVFIPTPRSITLTTNNKNNIDSIINKVEENVIAQDSAIKKIIPSILINQKLIDINNKELLKTQKNSILIDGKSGSGKTLIVEEIAKALDIPMIITSITKFSPVGYVGNSLDEILTDLYLKSNLDILKARRGIICLDEIDKLGDSSLELRKGLSQELLSWMNGTNIRIKYNDKYLNFNTSYLTFIALGAFSKLRDKKNIVGFDSANLNEKKEFDTDDYIKFGMQRELMARFNSLVPLKDLEIDDLVNILKYSKISPLKNFIELARIYNVNVIYDNNFLYKTATLAKKDDNGARSLQRIINKIKDRYIISIIKGEINTLHLTEKVFDENITNTNILSLKKTFN